MIGIGVIGYGYWGPNLVRNFAEARDARVVAICDLDPRRLAQAQTRYPGVELTLDHLDVLANPEIEAVAIATPVSSHFRLASQALRAGKHVLVEKPLATSSTEVMQLIEDSERRKRVLLVDHTFVYTGAVRKIRELIASNGIGELYYYDSVRVNLGLLQHDVSVVWDLAVHDLAIMDYVWPVRPCAISAVGVSHLPGQPDTIAYLTLFYAGSQIAHIHANWLAPTKVRRTLIGGSQKMIVYDDLEPSEKVKVYDKGITLTSNPENVYQALVGYRTGDMWAPNLDGTEALRAEIGHFVSCIEGKEQPVSDGLAGLRVVRILEAASESMRDRGRVIDLGFETSGE